MTKKKTWDELSEIGKERRYWKEIEEEKRKLSQFDIRICSRYDHHPQDFEEFPEQEEEFHEIE